MSNYKELKTISKEYTGKEVFIIAAGLGINVKDDKDCLIDFNNTFPLKNHNAILTIAGNKYVIYYKPCKFQEYYILHEICHYILKHNADGEYEETQSNILACMILIPDNAIHMDAYKISESYNIPVDIVISYINYLKDNTNIFKKRLLISFFCAILSVSVLFVLGILLSSIVFNNTESDKTSVVFLHSNTTTEQTAALTTQVQAISEKDIVYITKTGDKYHKQDCYYIRGKNTLAITLSEANSQGYLPCSVCSKK